MKSKYRVVVIGGGNAGLCAALSASRYSEDILLVETAPKSDRGGNSKYTRDIRYAHERDTYTSGQYTDQEFFDDVLKVTNNNTNNALLEMVVSESKNIPAWLKEHEVLIHGALRGTLHLGRTNLFMLGGGKALVNSYYYSAERKGIEILYNTRCTDLGVSGNTVRSVTLENESGEFTVDSESVVVASGGFEANLDWLSEYWGRATDNFIVRGTRHNTGEMLKVLTGKGAKNVSNLKQFHSVAVDARSPKYDGGIATRIDSIPFGITVNKDGQRFYDEGEDFWPKRYAIWGKLIAEQPEQIAFTVVDSKARGLFLPTIFDPARGENIAELSAVLGLDQDRLSETVRAFNQSVNSNCNFDPGSLDDCSTSGLKIPKSHWARAIDTPPYFGYSFRPGITFTYFGVQVDRNARVINRSGKPFTNLFAAGEIMSGNILTEGYLAGFGLTIGTVFGIIAGKEAAFSGAK